MQSLRTSSWRLGLRRPPIRLTRRVFWDLAICMVGLGLLVGAVFPPFAIVLGVSPEDAGRPTFVVACLVAGFLVAALNFGLARVVVGRRLGVLSQRLRLVADRISTASVTGGWADVISEDARIKADSDDALGETVRAFNSVLDALAAGEHSRSLVHNSSDVITVVDRRGEVRYQAPSIESVLGFAPAELVGGRLHQLVHPDDAQILDTYLALLGEGADQRPAVQLRMSHRDGSWRFMETAGTNLLDDPVVAGFVLTTRDVSERRALEEQLRHLAFHDFLTGLPNRALFLDRVAQAQDNAFSAGPAAVIFIDLDNLKGVNDRTGHEGGDLALQAIAARLSAGVAAEVTVARLGGDEFAVLLLGTGDVAAAPDIAHSLLASLTEPVLVAGHSIRPSMSIGVATSDSLGGARDLVRAADGAMYAAKKAGKGRVEVFQPGHHAAEMERQQMRADLQVALDEGQLVLHYQPIIDLGSGRISSFEALVRWQHPTRGLVPPMEFIPLAEESDLILSLGGWVLRQACRHAATWQSGPTGAAPGVKVSVNLSARQFHHPGLVAEVADVLAQAELDPRMLVLEITETLLLQDGESTTGRIRALQELGVALALDDFGTGYCSLSYLRRFAINVLKMDKSFLDDVPGNASDEALVRAIIDLGTTLNLQLVAEGVETAEQADALAALGCPQGQGYHFARPMTYAQALALVHGPGVPRQVSQHEHGQVATGVLR